MEGLLRSIVTAGYRQLEGRGFTLFRYDAISDSFPDSWTLEDGEIVRRYTTRVSRTGTTARILAGGQLLLVADTDTAEGISPDLPTGIRSFVTVPVTVESMPWGVLYVNSPVPHDFTSEDLEFVESFARHIGAFIRESREGSSGSNVELSTVRVLAATVDAKDHYTRHHSTNVSFYARLIAREMNLDPVEVRRVDLAGLLHDIGKIAIPDQILQKPGTLTAEERLLIHTHAAIGANILAQASHLQHLVPLVRHHHERWDGKGYPDGLKGNDIPLGAAILCLSDSFDTMTTRRVYRPPLSLDEAMAEIRRCSGTQFHPEVAAAMERVVAQARFTRDPWLLGIGSTQEQRLPSPEDAAWEGEEESVTNHRDPLEFLVQARRVQSADDLQQMVQRAGQLSLDYWSADAGLIYLVDRRNSTLVLEWSDGAPNAQQFLAACRAEGPVPMARGLLGWAVLTNQGVCLPDARRDARWPYTSDNDGPVSVLVAPITANGNSIGVMQLVSRGESRFGKADSHVMKIFTTLLGQAIDRLMTAWENREAYCTDALTGVRNTNHLRLLLSELEQVPAGAPVSVAFLDGDDLKRVNDRHGHEAGDMVIQHMARCISAWSRSEDVVIRYAGDEFLVFFPGLTLPEASARLERMRLAVSESPVELPGGYLLYVSVSAGITEINAGDGPHKAVRAAEQAMYDAKRTGKNRVWTAAS